MSKVSTEMESPVEGVLINGNSAIVEGALYSGLDSFFGYPITPSSTIMEALAMKLPDVQGGAFLQCEDEIASITACIGGSWTRKKTMTATSGPGFSLMQEGIGLASFTETPLVLAMVMRGGPSTGLPTYPAQQEIMQTHFGSHGDYLIPTIAPGYVQECFTFTVAAFNISEALRTPAFLLSDQALSTLIESVILPSPGSLEVINRANAENTTQVIWQGESIDSELVPPMNCFGETGKSFSTGLSHQMDGQPNLSQDVYVELLTRLREKILRYRHLFPQPELFNVEGAKVLLVTIGTVGRSAKSAAVSLTSKGIPTGVFRVTTLWPFPEDELNAVCKNIKNIVVVELSQGQLIWPVERYIRRKVIHIPYFTGRLIPPKVIVEKIVNIEKNGEL